MAPRKLNPNASERELEILKILWDKGACSVKDVNEAMNQKENVGYTTTLKLMQIMFEKGLLTRDTNGNKHIYKVTESEYKTQLKIVKDIMDKVFRGSAQNLVMKALSTKNVSREELQNIKEFISDLEEEN